MIEGGRAAGTIKVVGASRGGFIARMASARLDEPGIRWVIAGPCNAAQLTATEPPAMTGRVLAIKETTDTVAGPYTPREALHATTRSFEEVMLSTGRDHGFQFDADPAWIAPAVAF
ncbi:MAG: hypothetical protein AAF371_00865 [Pseudomonadota bacterium]